MSAPAPAAVTAVCRCSHGHAEHHVAGLAPQCTAGSCTCLQYRPGTAPDRNLGGVRAAPPRRPDPALRQPVERCSCGHARKRHEIAGFAPCCVVADCQCESFRLDAEGIAPVVGTVHEAAAALVDDLRVRNGLPVVETPAPEDQPADPPVPAPLAHTEFAEVVEETLTLEQLLERGRTSELAPIAKLAERITALAEDLRERLADEAAATGVKTLIADLEQQLAAARGQLREVATGKRRTPPASGGSDVSDAAPLVCPDCPKTFSTPQGVGAHRAKVHGYRKPR